MSLKAEQFVLYSEAGGEWRWTVYGENSKAIADSAEGSQSKADACMESPRHLVASVPTNAAIWNGDDNKWERRCSFMGGGGGTRLTSSARIERRP